MDLEAIKASVRLPKTNFKIKTNFAELEQKVLQAWEDKHIYSKFFLKENSPKFVLHDGPPYANGNIHVGHALNKILKDIIVKANSNLGYDVPFILGWDCHGLPIEWKIEEKYKSQKINKTDVNVVEFRQQCRDFADYWIKIQKKEIASLGVIADFDNPYITMDYDIEANIVKNVFKLVTKDCVYQGKKPILWSCVEQTALAEAEVEYKDKEANTVFCAFISMSEDLVWDNAKIIIWTTTPWTLPANQALAYGEEIEYGVYEIQNVNNDSNLKKGEKVILSCENATSLLEEFGVIQFTVLKTSKGLPANLQAKHCFYKNGFSSIIPVISADFVTTQVGSGLVHIAPSHGEDDFYLCKKYNIIPNEIVDKSGVYISDVPIFGGTHIFKAESLVFDTLVSSGTMIHIKRIFHSYPHSWRSKSPLIYLLTTQWFINLTSNGRKEEILESLKNVDFIPKKGRKRLETMVENRPDWCISRQRTWGVPISLFVHKKTNDILNDQNIFDNIVSYYKKNGVDGWFEDPYQFLQGYNHEDYYPILDVVDVWLDSGLSYDYVLNSREEVGTPIADVYLEGSDQHRGWFQSSLVTSVLLNGGAPYKKVVTHGFLLNEQNIKMSKSAGDALSPQKIVKEYGADVLRLWVASSNYTEDITFGKNILNQQAESYRKIRNTFRYLLSNLNGSYSLSSYDNLDLLDKGVLNQVYYLDNFFTRTFRETFEIYTFFDRLMDFIIVDLSAFYFNIKKDILYCDASSSQKYNSTLTVFDYILNYMFKWMSPIIPFTTEEVFAQYKNSQVGNLFASKMPFCEEYSIWNNENVAHSLGIIKDIRKVVLHAIEQKVVEKEINSSIEADVEVIVSKDIKHILEQCDFSEICVVSSLTVNLIDKGVKYDDYHTLNGVSDTYVKVSKHRGKKCMRCWKYYDVLNSSSLCLRCEKATTNV